MGEGEGLGVPPPRPLQEEREEGEGRELFVTPRLRVVWGETESVEKREGVGSAEEV